MQIHRQTDKQTEHGMIDNQITQKGTKGQRDSLKDSSILDNKPQRRRQRGGVGAVVKICASQS